MRANLLNECKSIVFYVFDFTVNDVTVLSVLQLITANSVKYISFVASPETISEILILSNFGQLKILTFAKPDIVNSLSV